MFVCVACVFVWLVCFFVVCVFCVFGLFACLACLFGLFDWLVYLSVSLNIVEQPVVLLCVRSKMLKSRWFCNVFAQKCKKPLVLLCFRSKRLKK